MFPGVVTAGRRARQQAVLPYLNQEMERAGINTPRRKAAFLTTFSFESWLVYDQRQLNDDRTYAGRGLIQLTGPLNYTAAGEALHLDLVGDPDLALELENSVDIAVWYWTVARPHTNEYADQGLMGMVNKMIGYPVVTYADGTTNDTKRCRTFAAALLHLDPEDRLVPNCSRSAA